MRLLISRTLIGLIIFYLILMVALAYKAISLYIANMSNELLGLTVLVLFLAYIVGFGFDKVMQEEPDDFWKMR